MPKIGESLISKMKMIVKNDQNFCLSDEKLMCNLCSMIINFDHKHGKSRVNEHIYSGKHQKMMKSKSKQSSIFNIIEEATNKQQDIDQFKSDLAEAFIVSNIPLEKLNNETLKNFFFKYTKRNVPKPSTLRNSYIQHLYEQKPQKIRQEIGENNVYFIIDDTTDSLNRYVFNCLVGKLDGKPSNPMLLSTKFLENVNHSTIIQAFNNSCQLLWPNGVKYDDVLLVVSDQASTMVKAMKGAKSLFPRLHHVTCLAHCVHRVCETIRNHNEEADEFISAMKKILRKSPLRRQQFKSICNIKLPPKPVITRWGTWLESAFYYIDNFQTICNFIEKLKN